MVKLFFILATILVFFSGCQKSDRADFGLWKQFTSERGKFEAVFPFNSSSTLKEVPFQNEDLTGFSIKSNTVNPRMTFQIKYTDLPLKPIVEEKALKKKYDSLRDEFVKLRNSELLNESDINVNGKQGRDLTIKEGKQISKYRMFLVGNRHYQIIVTTENSFEKDKKANKTASIFLDSFKIIEE